MSAAYPLALGGGLQPEDLDYAKGGGLVTGVVQDAASREVLMVGYLDEGAVRATLDSRLATFHSRTRGTRWTKGESSGNVLRVLRVDVDCDRDTLLILAEPSGPTCHTGDPSCFDAARGEQPGAGGAAAGEADGSSPPTGTFVADLSEIVRRREVERPEGSYTTTLFESGVRRIAQKVGEEGVETALAAVAEDDEALLGESADLVYHLLVLLRSRGLSLADVERVLRTRHR